MPSRPPRAPGRRPRDFPVLGRLPERKISLISFGVRRRRRVLRNQRRRLRRDRSPARAADLDVLEGNSFQANRLLINDGSGGLTEDTSSTLAVGTGNTRTIFAADIDGDGGACARRHAARQHVKGRTRG